MDKKKEVFISYSSKEYTRASQLRDILEQNGITVWLAPDDIPAGLDYADLIPDAITESKVFLLLLSENSQNSKFVPKELDQAIVSGSFIIPFQIDRAELTKAFDFRLKDIQRIDAFRETAKLYDDLVSLIKSVLDGKVNVLKGRPVQSGPKIKPVAVYIAGGLLCVALGVCIAMIKLGGKSDSGSSSAESLQQSTSANVGSTVTTTAAVSTQQSTSSSEREYQAFTPGESTYLSDIVQPEVQYDKNAPDKYDTEVTGLKMVKPLGNYKHSTKFRGFDAFLAYGGDEFSNQAGERWAGFGKGIDADITGDGEYTVAISANSLYSTSANGSAGDSFDSLHIRGVYLDEEGYAYPARVDNFDVRIMGIWDGKSLPDGSEPKNIKLVSRYKDRYLNDPSASGAFSAEQLSTLEVEFVSLKLDGHEFYVDPDVLKFGIIDSGEHNDNCYHICLDQSALYGCDWHDYNKYAAAEKIEVTFRIKGLDALIDELGGIPYQDINIEDLP